MFFKKSLDEGLTGNPEMKFEQAQIFESIEIGDEGRVSDIQELTT
jgi:hypothetical protein